MQRFEFQLNYDENSYTAIKYYGDDENAVVPEMFMGKPVTILYDSLFAGHNEIRSVSIPETVTDLGEFVFDGCSNLKHIELPETLEYFWGYTFARSSIEELTIPDKVRTIPPYAFKDCKKLKTVICGTGLRKISSWAFGGCDSLEAIKYSDNVEVSVDAFKLNKEILEL